LGQAARETGTAIEINACANFVGRSETYVREHIDYLGILAEEGASFSVVSDAHTLHALGTVSLARAAAEQLNLSEDRFWRPPCAPLRGGKA
jgi:histidinol phosphatase-like PHP family hydrolase